MKNWIYFGLLAIVILALSNSSGRAVRGQGSTGAPGDGTRVCQSCHNSADIQVQVNAAVLDLNRDTALNYLPGDTYILRVAVNTVVGEPKAFGMQAVSITNQLFLNTGTWDSVSHPLNVVYNPNTDRNYVEHFEPSDTNIFEALWIAPDTSVGAISFYVAANGVNLNGTSAGDGGGTDQVTLMPDITSSVRPDQVDPILVYPNPTAGSFRLTKRFDEVRIYNVRGQEIRSFGQGTEYQISDLANGIYWIQLIDRKNQQIYSEKLMKI